MRRLVDQSRSELTEQARSQQQRLTSNLRTLTDELDSMAGQGEQQGVAHDLVRQISQQARALGDWLDGNEPGAVLDEVKRFARRKPGTFLAVAAGLGILSGRMTRGLKAASDDEESQSYRATGYTAYGPDVPDGDDRMSSSTGISGSTGMTSATVRPARPRPSWTALSPRPAPRRPTRRRPSPRGVTPDDRGARRARGAAP